MGVRVPMQEREIVIIKRLYKVMEMPILKIAKAVGRHIKTICKTLKTKKLLSRGRAHSLGPSEVRHIVTVLRTEGCRRQDIKLLAQCNYATMASVGYLSYCGNTRANVVDSLNSDDVSGWRHAVVIVARWGLVFCEVLLTP